MGRPTKSKRNKITSRRNILQSLDRRTHYRGRLSTCTEGVDNFRIENSRRISQPILENECVGFERYLRKFSNNVHKKLRSRRLLFEFRIGVEYHVEDDGGGIAKLELIQEQKMHDIIDKGIRGGICNISHKHVVANSIYIPETSGNNLPSPFILYLDMNNLYGTAMSEPLLKKEFTFLSPEQVENFNFINVPDDGPIGLILEVHIDYPYELHDTHSDYSLCCEATSV